MQRIDTLLQKISELAAKGEKASVIDIDLMADYVRVIYADLLEWRQRVNFTTSLSGSEALHADALQPESPLTPAHETSLPEAVTEPPAETAQSAPVYEAPVVEEPIVIVEKPAIQEEISPAAYATPAPVVPEVKPVVQYNPPPKNDIRTVIGINDKYLFISELFASDKETYENTLDGINKAASYEEAIAWLNENVLFADNKEEAADTIQVFYDNLSTFFSAR